MSAWIWGGVAVDGGQHHGKDGGVLGGEQRAARRLLQAADLAAHAAAGQLRQGFGVALPGGERLQHGPTGDAVDVGDHAGQFQVPVLEQLFHPLLFGGAGLGEVAAIAGMGAQPADRFGRYEAGGDRAALGDLGEPDRVGPVGLGPARQRLDLPGVVELAVEPAGFQQEEDRFPVLSRGLHAGSGNRPAVQPVGQRIQLAPGGAIGPGLLLPAPGSGVAGHPQGDLDLGLGDVQASDPLGEQRLVLHVLHHRLLR